MAKSKAKTTKKPAITLTKPLAAEPILKSYLRLMQKRQLKQCKVKEKLSWHYQQLQQH
jgi:hypothetical protein